MGRGAPGAPTEAREDPLDQPVHGRGIVGEPDLRDQRVAVGHLHGDSPMQQLPLGVEAAAPGRAEVHDELGGVEASGRVIPGSGDEQAGGTQPVAVAPATNGIIASSAARPSRLARNARDASMLARIAPDGLVVCVASNARWSRSASIRSVLRQDEGRLAEGGQHLVRAGDHRVGAGLEGVVWVPGGEAQVGSPRLVHHDGDAVLVGAARDGRKVRERALVAGLGAQQGHGLGMRSQGSPHGRRVQAQWGARDRVGPHLDPDRSQTSQHQPGQDAAVGVACHQHHVPGLSERSGTGPGSRGWIPPSRTGTGRLPRGPRRSRSASTSTPPVSFTVSSPPYRGTSGSRSRPEVRMEAICTTLVARNRERSRIRLHEPPPRPHQRRVVHPVR